MKTYIANFESDGTLDQEKFKANTLAEAKKYAQAFKRRNFKGRMKVTVKEYQKKF